MNVKNSLLLTQRTTLHHESSYPYMWSSPQELSSCPVQTPPPGERAPSQGAVTTLPAACSALQGTQELHLRRKRDQTKYNIKYCLNLSCEFRLYLQDWPIGTEESKMTRPTLDHFPKGSRFTPLLIRACVNRKQYTVFFFMHSDLEIQTTV